MQLSPLPLMSQAYSKRINGGMVEAIIIIVRINSIDLYFTRFGKGLRHKKIFRRIKT